MDFLFSVRILGTLFDIFSGGRERNLRRQFYSYIILKESLHMIS